MPRKALDAAAVMAWASSCVRSLDALCADIDSINVYPVADSDTGSNLLYTMTGAQAAIDGADPRRAGEVLTLLARGAVASARGNSGVILSQVFRGLAESVGDADAVDGPGLAAALIRAERTATKAVARPVDGTMLTVLREAAEAAERVSGVEGALRDVVEAAADSAATALERTPQQLAVLADAGVVDAGGRGVLAVLDELVAVATGEPPVDRPEFAVPADRIMVARQASSQPWEVMYLLDGVTESALTVLRDALSDLGDCVTIAGDGAGSHAVHVHCGDIGSAIEAGLLAGRPREVRVESLAGALGTRHSRRAVLAVVVGRPLAELCRQEGITVLAVRNGTRPSQKRLERTITDLGASHVTVLAGGLELTGIAEAAAESVVTEDTDVVVVPCASPVQVLAALAVHDGVRRAADDVVAMAEAAAATRRGELSIAAEDAITWVGRANAGDIVGFVDDEVVLIETVPEPSADLLAEVAVNVLERMLAGGGELVTALVGAAAPDGIDSALATQIANTHPEVEFVAYPGGQTSSVLTFGVE